MTEKDEFYSGMAKRIRELRVFLGYDTAASFARAIGYPPGKYSPYERRGIADSGVLQQWVQAIETSGHGRLRYAWLLDCKSELMFSRPAPAVPPVQAEGNVIAGPWAS
ncbi:MAG: hypothetical protein IID48_21975 [Proteobacteria bacterium]|nr:hypothetical protein [Pseudomonadota bacterium]